MNARERTDTPDVAAPADAFDPLSLTVFAQSVAMIAEEMGTVLERAARSRPTSASAATRRARSSTPRGGWSRRRRTFPCTWARCRRAVRAVRACGAAAGRRLPAQRSRARRLAPPRPHDGRGRCAPEAPDRIVGYVAVRAHHADVGGMSPGSMPHRRHRARAGGTHPPAGATRARRGAAARRARTRAGQRAHAGGTARRPACAARRLRGRARRLARPACARRPRPGAMQAVDALLDYTERRARAVLRALDGRGRCLCRRASRAMA